MHFSLPVLLERIGALALTDGAREDRKIVYPRGVDLSALSPNIFHLRRLGRQFDVEHGTEQQRELPQARQQRMLAVPPLVQGILSRTSSAVTFARMSTLW